MTKKLFILLAVISLALAACGAAPTETFPISDPAKTLAATAGEQFTIVIESNASTGYHWDLVGDLDKTVVEFVSKKYKDNQPPMPGSGGVELWTFKAVAAGTAKITLGYFPPSNTPTDPQQKVTFTVTVK